MDMLLIESYFTTLEGIGPYQVDHLYLRRIRDKMTVEEAQETINRLLRQAKAYKEQAKELRRFIRDKSASSPAQNNSSQATSQLRPWPD
jgi:hypothetical protein